MITTTPVRGAQRKSVSDLASMIKSRVVSDIHRVESLAMTFIPMTEDSEVIGRVIAAMTARRSAAMVIFVSVRAP